MTSSGLQKHSHLQGYDWWSTWQKLAGLLPCQNDLLHCQPRLVHGFGFILRHSLLRGQIIPV